MNLKIHYSFNNSPSLKPVISQINPINILMPYFLNIDFNFTVNIIYLYICLPNGIFSDFPTRILYIACFLIVPRAVHLILLDSAILTIRKAVQIITHHSPASCSFLCQVQILSGTCSKTASICLLRWGDNWARYCVTTGYLSNLKVQARLRPTSC